MSTTHRQPEPDWERLTEQQWREKRAAHEARLAPVLDPHLARRRHKGKEPIADFVFEYYGFRPTRLKRWSPGFGVVLQGDATDFSELKGWGPTHGGMAALPELFTHRRLDGVRWTRDLLLAIESRPPFWGCYCLHEWAMVYKADDWRHEQVPLRVTPDALADIVESHNIVCSHWDAFRHFTPAARPLNKIQPAWDQMADLEQPACLHTNMDVYRWAYKLWPWIPGELIADAFFFALRIREVDMRASPYDFSAQGLEPILIETPEGKREFQEHQRAIREEAGLLRARLLETYEGLLRWCGS